MRERDINNLQLLFPPGQPVCFYIKCWIINSVWDWKYGESPLCRSWVFKKCPAKVEVEDKLEWEQFMGLWYIWGKVGGLDTDRQPYCVTHTHRVIIIQCLKLSVTDFKVTMPGPLVLIILNNSS